MYDYTYIGQLCMLVCGAVCMLLLLLPMMMLLLLMLMLMLMMVTLSCCPTGNQTYLQLDEAKGYFCSMSPFAHAPAQART